MRPAKAWSNAARSLVSRVLLRKCDRVGADVTVRGRPVIVNEGRITIGDRFHISAHPVMSNLSAQRGGSIKIGDDVRIAHGSSISAMGSITIGDGSRLGAFVLAMDTDYHVAGDASAKASISPIEIGRGVRIGNRVTLLRGTVIGDGATILDGSLLAGEIAAGARVSGVPAQPIGRGLRTFADETVDFRVRHVAQRAFGLAAMPALALGYAQISAWDSLGTLSLLLGLEQEFGVPLGEEQMRQVQTLADAAAVISNALEMA